jgi:hypothetical protein
VAALKWAAIFLALCGSAVAADLPPAEYVFDAALAADMLTTADIHNHARLYETNPILGRHPSEARIAIYGATSALAHAGVTLLLPRRFVEAWEALSIGVEVGYVAHNYHLGLRLKL